jgi:class 3 adenylate cyclase
MLPDPVSLILQLDRLIDERSERGEHSESSDETALLLDVAALLAQAASADLALFAVPDEAQPGTASLRAVIDRQQVLARLEDSTSPVKPAAGGTLHIQTTSAPLGNASSISGLIAQAMRQPGEWLEARLPFEQASLYAAGLGLKQGDAPPGVILLARLDRPFSLDETSLLKVAGSQIDNALRYFNLASRLRQEALALRTVLKVDRIRDSANSLDQLLNRSLAEVCHVIPAAVGFIMLYDRSGKQLELRASTDHSFLALPGPLDRLDRAAAEAIHTGRPVHKTYPDGELHALLGVPLILNNRIIGVLGVMKQAGLPGERDDFSQGDRQLLHAIASQMDTAIFERLQTQRLRQTFERSIGPQVMERLLQIDDRDLLKGERTQMAILFSDIRGFTAFSEKIDALRLEGMIDEHLEAMLHVILAHEGTVDKLLGDGIMALFNTPERQPDFVRRAVQTALEMQAAQSRVMQSWSQQGLDALPIGIGLAAGEAISGNFGSADHAEFTAIGSTVNLAARLCSVAEGGEILVDETIAGMLRDELIAEPMPPFSLKGISQPVNAWKVTGLKRL